MSYKGFITLVSGNVGAQIVTLITLPVVARVYGPLAFGMFGGVAASVSLCAPVIHGRFHLALGRNVDSQRRRALVDLALASCLTVGPVLSGAVILITAGGDPAFGGGALLLLAVMWSVSGGVFEVLAYERSALGDHRASSVLGVARAVLSGVLQLALSAMQALGLTLGASLGTVVVSIAAYRRRPQLGAHKQSLRGFLGLARENIQYPLFGVPQGMIAAFSWNAMPIAITRFVGVEAAGLYWLAYRVVAAPTNLVGGAYRQAHLLSLGLASAANAVRRAYRDSLAAVLIAALSSLFVTQIAELALPAVLGAGWERASSFVSVFSSAWLAEWGKIPMIALAQARGFNATVLIAEALVLAARVVFVAPLIICGDVLGALRVFALVGFVAWVIAAVWVARCVLHSVRS